MRNATKWSLSLLLLCLAVGCASQTPATTTNDSDDQQSAPEESACRSMPFAAGDTLGMRMFQNADVQVADVRD
jgi:hypothetical protein